MEYTRSLNKTLCDWLSSFATGQKAALARSAQHFASLVSAFNELEVGRPGEPGQTGAMLLVTSGLHRGASMELTAPEYRIGSDEDCDIVLRDASVAAHHCNLTREWSGFTVRDQRASTAPVIAPDEVIYDRGAVETRYDVGGVLFSLRHAPATPVAPEPDHARGRSGAFPLRVMPPALIAIAVAGVAVTIMALTWDRRAASRTPPVQAGYGGAGASVQAASEAVEQVRRALAAQNLRIELRNGHIYIEGRAVRSALEGRIQALAADLRGTIAVEDRVTYVDAGDPGASAGPLPVSVRSVMIGNPSYFLTDTGARYFVGAVLPDGAEVLAIDGAEIQFRRAGRVLAYKLQ